MWVDLVYGGFSWVPLFGFVTFSRFSCFFVISCFSKISNFPVLEARGERQKQKPEGEISQHRVPTGYRTTTHVKHGFQFEERGEFL